jgi:hypothetical protein
MDRVCAAGKRTTSATCLTKAQIQEIARVFGVRLEKKTKNAMWKELNARAKTNCTSDRCVVNRAGGLGSSSLRPVYPASWRADPNTWLTNVDIDNVMRQYERRYRSFAFVGVMPVDFSSYAEEGRCVVRQMCAFDALSLGKARLGFVFNLDRHDQSGSHWVALYVGLRKSDSNYGAYFFDSNGQPPPSSVAELMRKIATQSGDDKFPVVVNRTRKQFENTECGMFCVHFLVECLKRRPFKDIVRGSMRDAEMTRLRKVHFEVAT